MSQFIRGYCPMGCGETLFLGAGGYVTCSWLNCPEPDAAAAILGDAEHEHVVTFGEEGFSIKHPLRERLRGALQRCQLYDHITAMSGPPVQPGRYRAYANGDRGWSWQPLTVSSATAPEEVGANG